MFLKFTLSCLLVLMVAKVHSFTDCGSKLANVESVEISGCKSDAQECQLKRNTNVTIEIKLVPAQDIKSVKTEVHGIIMDIPIPFPIPQPDACKDNGLSCPLKVGERVTYLATLSVLKSYPKVKVDVKWELKTENGDLACIMIPAKIV